MSVRDHEAGGCTINQPAPDCLLIQVRGELDAFSVPVTLGRIQQALCPALRRVVLDLTELEFIDSTGIRMLMQVAQLQPGDTRVFVVEPQSHGPRRALQIVGIAQILPMVAHADDAVSTPG